MDTISYEEAKSSLSDVSADQAFWIYNGPIIRNIYELAQELEQMDAKLYGYHVTFAKNDFSNWIRDILKDAELAKGVAKAASSQAMAAKIRKRIAVLEGHLEAPMAAAKVVLAKPRAHAAEKSGNKTSTEASSLSESHQEFMDYYYNRHIAKVRILWGFIGLVIGILIGGALSYYLV